MNTTNTIRVPQDRRDAIETAKDRLSVAIRRKADAGELFRLEAAVALRQYEAIHAVYMETPVWDNAEVKEALESARKEYKRAYELAYPNITVI